jgi:hypothetical protein
MNIFFALLSGLLFGIGLIVSGMANPAKVMGFLDITRGIPRWLLSWAGPLALVSLLFVWQQNVNGRCVAIRCICPRRITLINGWWAVRCYLASAGDWRASAPARAGVAGGRLSQGVIFVLAMLAGMLLFQWFEGYRQHEQQVRPR